MLLWNKALLEKAGLDPEKALADWDELLANAEAITEAGNGEFWGGGCYVGPHFGGSLRYGAWLIENGGGFVDENFQPAFNSEANIETVSYLRKLARNIPVGLAGEPNEGAFWDAFNQNKLAYIIDGPWRKGAAARFDIEVGYSFCSGAGLLKVGRRAHDTFFCRPCQFQTGAQRQDVPDRSLEFFLYRRAADVCEYRCWFYRRFFSQYAD